MKTKTPKKNRAAVALANARWAKATPADRAKAAEIGRRFGGRPRTEARCACGEMTVKRAAQRNHKCQ